MKLAIAILLASGCDRAPARPAGPPAKPPAAPQCTVDTDCIALRITPGCNKPVEVKAIAVSERDAVAHAIVADGCQSIYTALDQIGICEAQHCRLSDGALAWSWATAIAPELEQLVPDQRPSPTSAPWFKDGDHITLFARRDWMAFDAHAKQCIGIDFKMEQNMLHATTSLEGGAPPKVGCRDEIELAQSAVRLDGPCIGKDGSKDQTFGGGSIALGQRLSKADAEGLVYDSISVQVTPSCRWHVVQRASCPAECRSCEIHLDKVGNLPNGRMAGLAPSSPPVVSSSCEPCPIDHNAALIPRLAAILRDRPFLTPFDTQHALRFYRSKAACEGKI